MSGDRYDAAGMHAVGRRGKEDGSGVIALRASTPASASEVGASSHFSRLSLGWLTGLEPATTGTTSRGSTN